jgi:alanyl-tRNA synthetase
VREVNGVKVVAVKADVADAKALRELSDTLKDRLGSGILVLGSEIDGKAALLVAVSKDLTDRYKAGDIIKKLSPIIGGSGGGKPELAQAGGSDPTKLGEALELVYGLV